MISRAFAAAVLAASMPAWAATTGAQEIAEQIRVSKAVKSPKIASHALNDYPKSGYKKTYATWGERGIARIIEHERNAALFVAENPKCDVVDIVGLSSKSAPPSHIVTYIDCRNGQRFLVAAEDLKKGAVRSQEDRNRLSKADAVMLCKDAVKTQLRYPAGAEFGMLSNAFHQDKTTGNIRVVVDFKAMNGLGNLVPQQGVCIFPTDGPPEVSIAAR